MITIDIQPVIHTPSSIMVNESQQNAAGGGYDYSISSSLLSKPSLGEAHYLDSTRLRGRVVGMETPINNTSRPVIQSSEITENDIDSINMHTLQTINNMIARIDEGQNQWDEAEAKIQSAIERINAWNIPL
ncbi:MAG: hypothetical protein R8J85_08965 [Mariprofundales bacterium]